MIQFNLLPDVKQQLMKAQRTKKLAMVIAAIVIGVCIVVLILMAGLVDGAQKKSLSDLNNSISQYIGQINGTTNLNQILTVQNDLTSLPTLDSQKPVATRLFGYLSQLTPNSATMSDLTVDFSANTINMTGSADSLATVDQFIDTLKVTTFTTSSSQTAQNAFSDVVLSSFSTASGNQGPSYDITADFSPAIFSSASNVSLNISGTATTRTNAEQPQNLFNQSGSN